MSSLTKLEKEKSKLTKEEWREYTKTVWQIANVSSPNHPAVFPAEIPKRLIKLFSFQGETILDPFAGTGTTAIEAFELKRKCICVEQNSEYIKIMQENCHNLISDEKDIQIIHGDSCKIDMIENNSVALIITSPPYWNKANYGNGKKNIGNEPIYSKFFKKIKPAFDECFRVLMPGRKLCLVTANVNQHTNHGLLTFPLAADFVNILREIGFVMVNEIIWSKDGTGGKWGSYGKQRPIFGSYPYPPNFHFKNIHEHILIFAKPSPKAVNGKTVISYDYLIGKSHNPKPKIK